MALICAATAVGAGIAAVAPTHRECTVEIENDSQCYSLINPRMHVTSGHCFKPLPLEVKPATKDTAIFKKTPHTACGTVGVFTYDLFNTSSQTMEKLAVMFSVPYDFNLYSNWFAVGVFSSNKNCDHDLYREMYYNNKCGFVRGKAKEGILTYKQEHVVIMASMADTYTPYLRVKVKYA